MIRSAEPRCSPAGTTAFAWHGCCCVLTPACCLAVMCGAGLGVLLGAGGVALLPCATAQSSSWEPRGTELPIVILVLK